MKTNWPKPYYSPYREKVPNTLGYRILGKEEILIKEDQFFNPSTFKPLRESWQDTYNVGTKVGLNKETYRRALYIDDPFAPPPEEWNKPGYKMLSSIDTLHFGDEEWDEKNKKWIPTAPKYENERYNHHPICNKTSSNINKNIIIKVGDSTPLSRAVQEIAFAAGYTWAQNKQIIMPIFTPYIALYPDKSMSWIHESDVNLEKCLVFDARTDMGKLIDLLNNTYIQGPIIYGYRVTYNKGDSVIKWHNVSLCTYLLTSANSLLKSDGLGNCNVQSSILLSSGQWLSREEVKIILDYVDKQNSS